MLRLYFYNDGIDTQRTAPLCEFTGDCIHDLLHRLDGVLYERYGNMQAMVVGFDPAGDCLQPTTMILVQPTTGRYFGRIYAVENEPAVR